MTRAALYVRVSTKAQLKGESPQTQEDDMRAFASQQGWDVVDVFLEAVTAEDSLFYRKTYGALSKALALIREHRADVLIGWRYDRIVRDPLDVGNLLWELREAGAQHVASAQEGVKAVDDIAAIVELVIKGYAGKTERLATKERTWRAIQERMESGKPLISHLPKYGYVFQLAPSQRHVSRMERVGYIVDPETGKIVQFCYEQTAAGMSLRELARTLDNQGVPTPSAWAVSHGYAQPGTRVAQHWSRQTLAQMLSDSAYRGVLIGRHHEFIRMNRSTDGKPQYKKRRRLAGDSARVEIPIPPLVSQELWNQVQTAKAQHKQDSPRRNADPESTLLRAGYGRCGACGSAMISGRHSSGHRVYRCSLGRRDGCTGNSFSLRASVVDGTVWAHVKEMARDTEKVWRMVEKRHNQGQDALEAAQRESRWLDEQLAETQEKLAYLKTQLGTERRQVIYDSLTEQIIQADATLTELQMRRKTVAERTTFLDAWFNHLDETVHKLMANGMDVRVIHTAPPAPRAEPPTHTRSAYPPSPEEREPRGVVDIYTGGDVLDNLSYSEKREILNLLGVQVRMYSTDSEFAREHDGKRWELLFSPIVSVGC